MNKPIIIGLCIILIVLSGCIKTDNAVVVNEIVQEQWYPSDWTLHLYPLQCNIISCDAHQCPVVKDNFTVSRIYTYVDCYKEVCLMDCDDKNKTICDIEKDTCQEDVGGDVWYKSVDDYIWACNRINKEIYIEFQGYKNYDRWY